MPCLSTGSKKFLDRPKVVIHFVPFPNILRHTQRWFPFSKLACTKVFEFELNFWTGLKKIGPAQNVLGQGISILASYLENRIIDFKALWHSKTRWKYCNSCTEFFILKGSDGLSFYRSKAILDPFKLLWKGPK